MTATFVKAPHHMQVKLAAKNGFDLRVSDDNTHYVLVNIDAATTIYGMDAAQLINDGSAQRMLLAEYPMLSLKQDLKTFGWTISKGRKVLATASCLEDAKDLALEELAAIEQKGSKPAKAKADKPAKPVKAKVAASDEDGDEEAESDEDNAVADEGDEQGEEETESKSIVKRKYKKLYRPHKDTNGDGLSDQIRDHVSRENYAGDKRIDVAALKRFAIANDVWQASYGLLNVGQMKMNITNRLRGLIRAASRDGKAFDIKWS